MRELKPGQAFVRIHQDGLPEVRVLLRRSSARTAWGYYWVYLDLISGRVDKTVEFYFLGPRTSWKLVE